jgi:phosphatidylserine/phosphatidylglycerophosphate/cardiolipin synthase-like enzyme
MSSKGWPERPLGSVDPLLTAAEAYPAMERAALRARRRIWLWFRLFDPMTRLTDPEAREAAGETWRDLIAHRLAAGVEVAVAVSDFDAAAAPGLHAEAWRTEAALRPLTEQGLRLLVADHPARAGLLWRLPGGVAAAWRIEKLRGAMNRGEAAWTLDELPALRPVLAERAERVVWRSAALPPLKPGTHHQKVALFDDDAAILGGIDVNPRRWDDPEHDRPAEETWRDLSLAVSGPVATDVAAHLARLWNDAVTRRWSGVASVSNDAGAAAAERAGDPPTTLSPPAQSCAVARGGESIRLSTTVSRISEDPQDVGPETLDAGLEADHLALIESARDLIFIETQFLRSPRIGRALAQKGETTPELGLIVVLPAAPEDVAFDKSTGLDARYGEYLQSRQIRRIRRAFGDRAAFVSPARAAPRDKRDRSALGGAGIIYVHSKALIVDDRAAIVSSANLNGRSMRWDTEAGVVIRSRAVAAKLRRRMAQTLLPAHAPEAAFACDAAAPAVWARIAARNAARAPAAREGKLMPYPLGEAENFGAPAPGAPEEIV